MLSDFSYLTDMPIHSLTFEMVQKIKEQVREKVRELEELKRFDTKDMWRSDLSAFLAKLDEIEKKEALMRQKEDEKLRKNGKLGNNKPRPVKRKLERKEKRDASSDNYTSETESKGRSGESKKRGKKTPGEKSTESQRRKGEKSTEGQRRKVNAVSEKTDANVFTEVRVEKGESLMDRVRRLREQGGLGKNSNEMGGGEGKEEGTLRPPYTSGGA